MHEHTYTITSTTVVTSRAPFSFPTIDSPSHHQLPRGQARAAAFHWRIESEKACGDKRMSRRNREGECDEIEGRDINRTIAVHCLACFARGNRSKSHAESISKATRKLESDS